MQRIKLFLNRKTGIVLISLMFLLIFIVFFAKSGMKDNLEEPNTEKNAKKNTTMMYSWSEEENEKRISQYSWVNEVAYDGTYQLSAELFRMAFRTSDNNYIPNIKMEDTYGEEMLKRISSNVKSYLGKLYGSSYREILGDQDGFIDDLDGYWYNGSNIFYETDCMDDTEDYIDDESYHRTISEWYIDNSAVMECEVSTAPCMVYQNEYQFVCRSEIALTAHDIGEKAIGEYQTLTGIKLINNETVYYVVEVKMTMSEKNIGLEVLYQAEY